MLVDSRLEVPLNAKILAGGNVLVAGAVDDAPRIAALRGAGAEVVILPNATGKVELADLIAELARRGLNEIHLEAGEKLNGSLVAAGLVDELLVYLAPKLVGSSGLGMFNLPVLADLAQARTLDITDCARIGSAGFDGSMSEK